MMMMMMMMMVVVGLSAAVLVLEVAQWRRYYPLIGLIQYQQKNHLHSCD